MIRAQLRAFDLKLKHRNRTAPLIAEYCARKRLAEIGINADALKWFPVAKADTFLAIADAFDKRQAEKLEKQKARRNRRIGNG